MYKLSIVLPTYNRKQQLMQVIDGLESQTFNKDDFEVIIVSDGSTDGTHQCMEQLKTPLNLSWFKQTNQGVAATRNHGFAKARGEIILFIDDDVVPDKDLLTQHYQTHLEAGMLKNLVVIGPMLSPPNHQYKPWVEWEQSMLYKQYDSINRGDWEPTARQFYTGNSSIHLTFLKDSGGFDATFLRAEDIELAFRLAEKGAKFVFNNKAIGYHYAQRSYASWANIPYSYGCNDVIFTVQHGQTWLIPTVMEEYGERHLFIRLMNKLCMDRALISNMLQSIFRVTANTSHAIGLKSISRASYSFIFNIRHYQGMSDQLGGRTRFFQLLALHGR
ncbi:MAG: glycosyltransferase involved in cell wall biosynthesis [Cellvibrionaceae bacterium]|jgi:glycosyltransferase involved in cell wall biosynthesis